MPIHEIHEALDGGSIRVAIRRPKRDRKIRRGEERPLPHLGNKQKHRQDADAIFQPSTVQKTEEVQATPVDDSTTQPQTKPFKPFFTQESTMTQATTQEATQTTQAETTATFEEQLKDIKKEVLQQEKKKEKSSFWKTTAKVAGGVAAVAGIAAGGYFAWKKYGSS